MASQLDFLHPDNICGQTLLSLVARGSAIIAELLRLSDHVPSVFKGSPNNPEERARYAPILFDFRYLKTPELHDAKIDADPELVDLDEEFRETHMQLLQRFYKLFESIYRYATDFVTFLDELQEGVFIQHTFEGILMDVEGRQLMCEALYLYGVMLLLLDSRIDGLTRERMIVSYYRYKGPATLQNVDEVCKLCRNTGFVPGVKRPSNYPEELFARIKIPRPVIEMIIGRLRADDIYNHTSAYPSPAHRSTALAGQAAMLYVCLYFAPDILEKKEAVMREIVDKYFSDTWVIPMYLGFTVDLSEAWEPYKAARHALRNVMTKQNVLEVLTRHKAAVAQLNHNNRKLLTEGVLVEEYVLENIRDLLHHVRCCNVTLRWFLLHRTTVKSPFKEIILGALKEITEDQLLILLTDTAQLEFQLKALFKRLLDTKQSKWEECRKEAAGRLQELSEYFSGTKELTRIRKNENLQAWFKQLADEVAGLDFNNSVLTGRKLAQLMQALEDVQEFHQVGENLQVRQFLADTKDFMKQMIRAVNVSPKVLADLDIISDFSYAWELINDYTALLHRRIKERPNVVLRLRSTFLKLSSILSTPLYRITQAQSKDDVSVAEYYSSELVNYVRKVLDVIPQSVFEILDQIISMMTHRLKPVPMKLERKYFKDIAQLEERYALAKYTHEVSVLTKGILSMSTTLMGIIKLDPQQLLEDGIRKHLVYRITQSMHDMLDFRTGKIEDFEERLTKLGTRLDGFRQAFEYIQDYIHIYGLKIWQEEFSRIIAFFVEQECNRFLKKKILPEHSQYQSRAIPIPLFAPPQHAEAKKSEHFMGRVVRELLAQTDPRKTTYVESMQGWYDEKQREVVGIRTFSLLHRGVGTFGLIGVDKLLCFMIVHDLTSFVAQYRRDVTESVGNFLRQLTNHLLPTTQFPADAPRLYRLSVEKISKIANNFREYVTRVGQSQLIRRQIANELNFSCKMDSKILSCALEAMNSALLNDVRAHYARPDSHPYPGNPILPELSKYLEAAGINNSITKIYITTEPLENIAVLMFLLVLGEMSRLQWDPVLSTLVCRDKKTPLDGAPFVVGVATILKQFHSSHTHLFLSFLGQYVRANISAAAPGAASSKAVAALPSDVTGVLLFLEEFSKFTHLSRTAIEAVLPPYVFDRFKHATQ